MSSLYQRLGLATAGSGTPASTGLRRRLRQLEVSAAELNLEAENVHLAAEIAAFCENLDDHDRIALILLILVSLAASEEGSTRFPVTGAEAVEPMRRMLGAFCGREFGADGPELMRNAIEVLLASGEVSAVVGTEASDYKPLIYKNPFIYQHRILTAETLLAAQLTSLCAKKSDELLSDVVDTTNSQSHESTTLSDEQRKAVEQAARRPLTIISGGPGTGKTSIVVALVKRLIDAGFDSRAIALAAPTGKATNRIAEALRMGRLGNADPAPEPATLHRLLGYSPTLRRFRHHRNNPLPARVVIVDEGSMIDLELMAHLLDALRPDARLVILGDADQLPSVAAGAVFRDLMLTRSDDPCRAPQTVRLTRNFRTDAATVEGSALFRLAAAVKAGDAGGSGGDRLGFTMRRSTEDLQFVGAEWLDEEVPLGAFIERWYLARIHGPSEGRAFNFIDGRFAPDQCEAIRGIFERSARSRILCVTRALTFGSERINRLLHRRRAFDARVAPERAQFIAGEPVMILRNDYSRMLFNGDQGVVLRVRGADGDATLNAVFPRGDNFVAFGIEALKNHLELCYAMTVHKAQGSEFDAVAVMLPDNDLPLLTREILYTAVSRARSAATIVGRREIFAIGLARRIERFSGLRERIEQMLNESPRA